TESVEYAYLEPYGEPCGSSLCDCPPCTSAHADHRIDKLADSTRTPAENRFASSRTTQDLARRHPARPALRTCPGLGRCQLPALLSRQLRRRQPLAHRHGRPARKGRRAPLAAR